MTTPSPRLDGGHTAGPWVAEPADMFGDHNIVLADQSEDSRAIAAVVSNMRDPAEVAANASVIAEAPNLLNCLIAAEWLIDNQLDGEFPETLTEIRTAIARARGKDHA